MKKIHFVLGPSGCGKTVFIKQHPVLSALPRYDILSYQTLLNSSWTARSILESYVVHRRAWLNFIESHPTADVVVEHTLLRAVRRAYYLDKVKDLGYHVVCWCPTRPEGALDPAWDVFERPTHEEGFNEIKEISPWTE